MEFSINRKVFKAVLTETVKAKGKEDTEFMAWKISFRDGQAEFFRNAVREQVLARVDVSWFSCVVDSSEFVADHNRILTALKISKEEATTIDTVAGTVDGIPVKSKVDASKIPEIFLGIEPKKVFCFSSENITFSTIDKKALPHVSDDETRYFMTGVFFESVPFLDVAYTVNIAATNGRTLFLRDAFVPSSGIGSAIVPPCAFVRPKKTERVIAELIEKKQAGKKYFSLESIGDGFSVKKITECIDGQYPNYRRVTPDNLDPNFSVNTVEFKAAIKSASVLCNKKNMRILLTINKTGGTVTAYGEGATEKEFPFACEFDRDDYKIAINADYIAYSLPDTEKTFARFSESNTKALTIQNSGIAVVMPMQLD